MAYDEALAERVRERIAAHSGVTERMMFGGLAFMISGNMACGVIGEDLIVRLGDEDGAEALEEPGVREFDFTGKPMKSMVYVRPEATTEDDDLTGWVDAGASYAESLPAK